MKDAVERVQARAARDRRHRPAAQPEEQEAEAARKRTARTSLAQHQGPEAPSSRRMTDDARAGRRTSCKRTLDTILARRGPGRAGEEGAGRGQPPPRRLDREEVHEPRPAVPRPDPGRQHRPDEGRRQVRVPPRLQVLDLRDVVDPPGHHPRDRRPGAHDPHPGAHDRDDQQADPHLARARAGARPRADLGGDREADGHPGLEGPQGPEDRAGADLARDADRRGGRFASRRLHRGSPRGLAGRERSST